MNRRHPLLAPLHAIVCAALSAQSPPPGPPVLLGDLNGPSELSGGSMPSAFAALGGVTLFAADDGVVGRELYRSLGTQRTTVLIADIAAGPLSSTPEHLTVVGGQLFFFANDGPHGREPWVTDGTAAGTRRIADVVPGTGGMTVIGAFAVGDRMVFFAQGDAHGVEPWVTDGTAAGTFRLADISPGAPSSIDGGYLRAAVVHDDASGRPVLDFAARTATSFAWWRTDGTVAGTREVKVVFAGLGTMLFGTAAVTGSGRVVFPTTTPSAQGPVTEIWSSDGTTAGTTSIASPTSVAPVINGAAEFGGEAWFVGWDGALLFATDGTAAGSRLVSAPGGSIGFPLVSFLGEARGALWLVRGIANHAGELLRVDAGAGAAVVAGTVAFQGPIGGNPPRPRPRIGDRFLVVAEGALWAVDVVQGSADELAVYRGIDDRRLAVTSGRAFFGSYDTAVGAEPWTSDGTSAGTVLLRDLNTTPPVGGSAASSNPHGFTRFKDGVVFAAHDATGPAIWRTDGTAARTTKVVGDLVVADRFVPFGDRLAFRGRTAAEAFELFVTDGTAAGTRLVVDLNPGPVDGLRTDPIALGDRLVLHGNDAPGAAGLFVSDAQTIQPLLSMPGTAQVIGRLERIGDRVVMLTHRAAAGPAYVGEVWSTDGSAAGSVLAASMAVPGNTATPVVFADRLWFVGVDPVEGVELFASDGTAAGTARVGVMTPGPAMPSVFALTVVGDKLFAATSAGLFVITDLATGPVRVPLPGLPVSGATAYAAVGGRLALFLTAPTGNALWLTDGTPAGTVELQLPPHLVAAPASLMPAGERFAFFRAVEFATGRGETWVTDGSQAGTVRYGEHAFVATVSTSAGRYVPAVANGLFYVPLEDVRLGIEPAIVDVGATAEVVGAGCGRAGRSATLQARGTPRLGARCELAGASRVGAAAVVLLSATPLVPTFAPGAGACTLEFQAAAFVDLPPIAMRGGTFVLALDIPGEPTLAGLQVTLQALVGPTDAALGVDLTNGVMWTLGR